MKLVCCVFLVFLSAFLGQNDASKILGVFPMAARSHYIIGSALMKGLAEKGHDITLISAFTEKSPPKNFRSIETPGVWPLINKSKEDLLNYRNKSLVKSLTEFYDTGVTLTRIVLEDKSVQALLNDPKEQFDLIIVEIFLDEALLGLGHHFNAPVIGVSTFGASVWTTDLVGSPSPPSYVPNPFLSATDRMSLSERLTNLFMTVFDRLVMDYYYLPRQAEIYHELFADPKPNFYDMRKNVSLVLLNSHVSLSFPRPYLPNMIEVGGMNIKRQPKPLPTDVQKFLDTAKEGAIYFSMGSNLKSKQLPKEKLDILLRTFNSLKQKVLWKWEDKDLPGKGDNIFISEWFPQDDILAHPNVKGFITHGGLLSTTEAIYHGVPLIGMPMFADQFLNMARAERIGYGLQIDYNELSQEKLTKVINELVSNDKYKKKILDMSSRFRDQPMTPLETAIYWVEYVIRQKGAPHLHSGSQDLSFVQYHNLDAFAVIFGVLAVVVFVIFIAIRKVLCLVFGKKSKNVKQKKH